MTTPPGPGDAELAAAADHASRERLRAYAGAEGVDVREGEGWLAVRTRVASNDLNGVVSTAPVPAGVVETLCAWFAAVPASWLLGEPDVAMTDRLRAAGARPERTGVWSGRVAAGVPPQTGAVRVRRVEDGADLDRWLDVATACSWIESTDDRTARRRLYAALGLDHPRLSHWLAFEGGAAVGFGSVFLDGGVADLCNLGVLEAHRRRGIGRALVSARVAYAVRRGAAVVVSAPSPDGWQLQRALGFRSVPVIPDTCFYLP